LFPLSAQGPFTVSASSGYGVFGPAPDSIITSTISSLPTFDTPSLLSSFGDQPGAVASAPYQVPDNIETHFELSLSPASAHSSLALLVVG
jgi:hypothetical protein